MAPRYLLMLENQIVSSLAAFVFARSQKKVQMAHVIRLRFSLS